MNGNDYYEYQLGINNYSFMVGNGGYITIKGDDYGKAAKKAIQWRDANMPGAIIAIHLQFIVYDAAGNEKYDDWDLVKVRRNGDFNLYDYKKNEDRINKIKRLYECRN